MDTSLLALQDAAAQVDFTPVQNAVIAVLNFIPNLLVGFIIFLAFWIGSKIFRRVVMQYGNVTRVEKHVLNLFVQVVNAVVLVVGAITALGTIGLDVTALVAGLGLTSFALGFALQDILSNVLSGVLLLVYRPFRLGNYVKVGSSEGHVVAIDLRYTTLRTETQYILIPNQQLFKESIIVLAHPPTQPAESAPMQPTRPPSFPPS
jgi:small-conductance mechanosensitive channel